VRETYYVPRVYNAGTVLWVQCTVRVMLFPAINFLHLNVNTLRSMCSEPSVAVFGTFLMSCFPLTLFRYFLNYMQIFPVALVVNGITVVSTCHIMLHFCCNLSVVFLGHISIFSSCGAY